MPDRATSSSLRRFSLACLAATFTVWARRARLQDWTHGVSSGRWDAVCFTKHPFDETPNGLFVVAGFLRNSVIEGEHGGRGFPRQPSVGGGGRNSEASGRFPDGESPHGSKDGFGDLALG